MSYKIGNKDKLNHGVLDDLDLAYINLFDSRCRGHYILPVLVATNLLWGLILQLMMSPSLFGYITFWLDYNSNMAVQLLMCCGSFKQGIGYSHKGTVHGGMFFVGGKCMLVHVKNCVTQIKHSAWPFKILNFCIYLGLVAKSFTSQGKHGQDHLQTLLIVDK